MYSSDSEGDSQGSGTPLTRRGLCVRNKIEVHINSRNCRVTHAIIS